MGCLRDYRLSVKVYGDGTSTTRARRSWWVGRGSNTCSAEILRGFRGSDSGVTSESKIYACDDLKADENVLTHGPLRRLNVGTRNG